MSNLEDVLLRGLRVDQPLATDVVEGTLYFVTDELLTEQARGGVWLTYSDSSGTTGITQLTGDVTAGPGTGSQATTIANNAVSNAKLRDSAALSVIGRAATTSGDPADIATTTGSFLALIESGAGTVQWGTIATTTITAKAVTYAKVQDVAGSRLLGRGSTTSGSIEEITLGTNLTFSGTTLNAAGGAGAGWNQILSTTASGTQQVVTGLTSYSEVLAICRLVTLDTSTIRQLVVSTNNGSTFLTASGDYVTVNSSGIEAADDSLPFHASSNTNARSGWILIRLFNVATSCKIAVNDPLGSGNGTHYITTTAALNAIRFQPASGNFNGGKLEVYAR